MTSTHATEPVAGAPEPIAGEHSSDNDVDLLKQRIFELQQDNERLAATIRHLQDVVAVARPQPVDGFYAIDQFITALAAKRGRTYGWRVDYAAATETSPDCRKVTTEDIARWQRDERVPSWAFLQIDRMVFRPRKNESKPNWTKENIDFLIQLLSATPKVKNLVVAQKCSEHFGRPITEQAIKGEKYRLVQAGRLYISGRNPVSEPDDRLSKPD